MSPRRHNMAHRVSSIALCCVLQACLVLGAVYTPSGGPVYVNPAAPVAAAPAVNAEQLVTQTVYGFLDFTTTIGNTVMVFSPQSAPAAEAPKPPSAPPAQVIETKPPPSATTAAPDIKPSKTTAAANKSSEKKAAAAPAPPPSAPAPAPAAPVTVVSSVVEVVGGPAPPPPPPSAPAPKPHAAPSSVVEVRGPASKVEVREGTTKVEVHAAPASAAASAATPVLSSIVEVRASGGDENNVDDPEYDFLSRQPAQIVDETYKVINLKPSAKAHKARAGGASALAEGRPKGNNGRPRPAPSPSAQGPRILKTAAPALAHKRTQPAPALDPTPAAALHEDTVALPLEQLFASQPPLTRASRRPAPAPAPAPAFSSRFHRNRAGDDDERKPSAPAAPANAPAPARSSGNGPRPAPRKGGFSKPFARPAASAVAPELATVTVREEASPSVRRFGQASASPSRRAGFRPSAPTAAPAAASSAAAPAAIDAAPPAARRYKSRPSQPSPAADASTSLYKFKLSRPAGRWSYKTTPKPRVAIRRQDGDEAPAPALNPAPVAQSPAAAAPAPQLPDDAENEPAARLEPEQASPDSAAEPSDPEERPAPAAETIKVQISTPADFSDVYYELATIKSPYTFQAGTVKNTRYITVTSTLAKTLSSSVEATSAASGIAPSASAGASASLAPGEEPLTENLLASTLTPHYERREPLDADGIATLPPIALAGDQSTPPLQTLTEAFSTTQLLLKTHVLPVIRDGTNTTRYTLVQSYHVTRLVTALKTLPPMEVYHFVPSKTLTDLNTRLEEAGSELHLELDFGEEDGKENDEDRPAAALRALAPDLDLANVGSDFDLADVDRSRLPELQQHLRLKKAQSEHQAHNQLTTPPPPPPPQPQLSPEQLQQLAILRLFNPAAAAALPQVITTSRPIVKVETVFESHVIPVLNGQTTSYSTISRPIATVSKTEYELATSTVPLPLPLPPVNPLFPNQQQPQFAVTSSPLVTQTVVTATESKVLKLTFGAKTAYTTLYSTRVVPTVLTTYLTASVPVQPTAAFPGYFPPAYPQFPFVG